MPGDQTRNGKAFEYAVVNCIDKDDRFDTELVEDEPFITAKNCFESLDRCVQTNLEKAAATAVDTLSYLEPMIYDNASGVMKLQIQSDSRGIAGDVRDVVLTRGSWEIGISCKHNHQAVKHPRLSSTIDFGEKWLGIPCSDEYWNEIRPIFDELKRIRDDSSGTALWPDDTHERFYVPILNSFIKEMKRIYREDPRGVAHSLIHYMLGREDFYKVMTDDTGMYNTLEAVNINGTLGQRSSTRAPRVSIRRTEMPDLIHHIGMAENSDTTLLIVLDRGWQISMRLHSAKRCVEPSLKFDVQLISVPRSLHSQISYWEID